MPDQELLSTLQLVRTAKNTVANAELDPNLSAADRSGLITLYWDLDDMEDKLILQDLGDQIDTLTSDCKQLQSTVSQMDQTIGELANVAKDVSAAAAAVGALVQIAAAAAKAGL
jgi:hypothetical protein